MNIFSRLKYSLFGYKGYIDLVKEGISKAILHLIILSLISTTVLGITFIFLYNVQEKILIEQLEKQENEFIYENGALDYKNGFKTFEDGEYLFLIDTSKSIDNYDELRKIIVHKDTAFALVKDGIIVRSFTNEFTFKYSDIFLDNINLNNDSIINLINQSSYLKYIFIVLIALVVLLSKFYSTFIVSIVGVLINLVNRTNIRYSDIFKISAYSLTLVTILELFLPISSFSLLISGTYLILAMNYMRTL